MLHRLRIAFTLALLMTVPVLAQTPAQLAADIKAKVDQLLALINTPPPSPSTVVTVPAGGDVQKALDAAQPGQTIQLAAGATYTGNFVLRKVASTPSLPIIIRSSDDTQLPPGVRVKPADAPKMAKLAFSDQFSPVLSTEDGAHDYVIIGLEILGNARQPDRVSVVAGRLDATLLLQQPVSITFDRVYVHGDPVVGGHKGFDLNGTNLSVLNSDVRGFWEIGRDSQAILTTNGPGPYDIENNYLEATGENFLVGGADPAIAGLVPSDFTIRGNYFFKPLAWKTQHPGSVKNLFELKNAQRVLIENNVFENAWADAQSGSCVQLTVRNQDGTAPQSTVADVTWRYNVVKHCADFAFNELGVDDQPGVVSVPAVNVSISHTLLVDVAGGFQLSNGPTPSTITHTTVLGVTGRFLSLVGLTNGLVMKDNVLAAGAYGITGDGTVGTGTPSLYQGAPGAVLTSNVIQWADGQGSNWWPPYPAGNYSVAKLPLDSLYRYTGSQKASDGTILGADINAIRQRIPWLVLP